ncbi:MAG: flagellar biosynthesis protein FlhF, partial [Candidatus Eisenbacteria bacterium]
MRIRRFRAAGMAQALEAVRRALGPDAVILETRPVPGAGSGGRGVEVLAAADRHPGTAWDAPLPQAPPSRPPRPPLPGERGPAADRD